MEKNRLTFRKEERLKSVKAITALFQKGRTFLVYPVKIVWMACDPGTVSPVQAGFSVSSKVFRKSTIRNLLKRRMREAYRHHKNELYDSLGETKIILMFIYVAKEETEYAQIEKSVASGLKKIIRKTGSD